MRFAFLMTAAVCMLGACAPMAEAPPTAADPLIGKTLISENGTVFLFNADGTIAGELGGEAINGVYKADANEICSSYTSPPQLTEREYCSQPVIEDGSAVFVRRDGTRSQTYRIEG